MEKLTSYLKSNGIAQTKFASEIGITQSSLSKMCAGQITPSLETAVRISTATGGAVPVESWVNSDQDRKAS